MKKNFFTRLSKNSHIKDNNNILVEIIINDPESKMRIRIKEIDEIVNDEMRRIKYNAPLTVEEKVLLR